MGASQTKAVSVQDITKKVVTNVLVKNSQECSAKNNNSQSLSFSNIKAKGCSINFSNINQKMNIKQDFSCVQKTQNDSKLQNKLKEKLKNEVESSSKGLTIGLSNTETETITKLTNEISNSINISNVARCTAESINNQKMKFDKIEADCTDMPPNERKLTFKNIEQAIISAQVTKCIQGNTNTTKSINKLQSVLESKAKSKSEGISLPNIMMIVIGGGLSAFLILKGNIIPYHIKILIKVILFIIFILAIMYFMGFFNNKDSFTNMENNIIKKLQNKGKLTKFATKNQKKVALKYYNILL